MRCVTVRQGDTPTSLPTLARSVSRLIGSTLMSSAPPPGSRLLEPGTSFLEQRHPMLHRLATVDRQDGAGDIASGTAAQIERCARNVIRYAYTAERNVVTDMFRLLLGGGGKRPHPALEAPRRKGVDGDAAGGELDRQCARQVMHGGLGGGVGVSVVR